MPARPSLSTRNRAAVLALAIATGAAAATDIEIDQRVVSANTLVAAARSPETFARALAKARIPAGFLVTTDENTAMTSPRVGTSGRVPLKLALDRFSDAHPLYVVEQEAAALWIHPIAAGPCDAMLRTPVQSANVADTLPNAASLVVHRVDPAVAAHSGGGQIGSAITKPGEPVVIPQPPFVHLEIQAGTLFKNALDEIVVAAPGTTWMVQHESVDANPDGSCVLRLFREDGTGYSFTLNPNAGRAR
jgi:hypothetical protein